MKRSYLIIFVLLVLFCFSGGTSASLMPINPASIGTAWDGTTDTDWYNTTDQSFTLTTPEQLAGLAQIVNGTALGITADNFSGKTITLTADLDLGGVYENNAWNDTTSKKWIPIGLGTANAFAGTFHGAGYAIDNLYINATVAGQGLFGYTTVTATLKNFVIESGSIKSTTNYAGAIVGNHKGLIQNCQNRATVSGNNYSGGIAGGNTGYIVNSCNTGAIVATGTRTGGIAGENTGSINRCYNTADVSTSSVSSSAYIGGLTGGGVGTIIRSYSSGNVVGKGTYCGGICGFEDFSKNGTYSDCYYLKTDAVNSKLFAVGLSKTPTSDATGTASKNEAELKALATQLGSAFTADTENRNNGYPLLKWQVTGEYDGEETEGLAIDSVTVAGNGKAIIIKMNKALTHSTLSLTDFTGSYTNGGQTFVLDSAAASQNDFGPVTTVSYKVSLRAESSGSVTVQYRGQTAVTTDYTVDPSTLWIDYAATGFDGGDGTLNNPYQINTAEQLAYLAAQVEAGVNYSGVYFVQTTDINLGASLSPEGVLTGRNWVPIGYSVKPVNGTGVDLYFSGNYDGQNHAISGMVVAPAQTVYTYSFAGMFGFTQKARILNIQLVSPQISVSNYNAAGLIGNAVDTTVKNCHLLGGTVTATGATGVRGGLIANLVPTATNAAGTVKISACSSSATVQSPGVAGGLIGTCSFAKVTNNQVTTTGYVSIEDCRATGSVTGNGAIGGLVGNIDIIYAVSIDHCYASGDVTSANPKNAGGILGYVRTDPNSKYRVTDVRVTNCAALNTRITYTGTGEATDYDRIVGNGAAGLQTDFLTLENNDALELLTINGAMTDCADGASASGANRTKEDLALVETWNHLHFNFSDQGPWRWDDDATLPMLRYSLADYAIDIVTQPLDATAYLNKDAVFRVQSSNGVGNHSYQWQNSPDGETWIDVGGETETLLQVSGDKTLNGYQYRCVIRDEGGQTANSNAATLTVKSKKYTAEDAAANLYARYLQSGVLSQIKEPSSLYAYRQDLSAFTNELKYYGDYYVGGTVSNKLHGGQPWAFLDELAAGDNPRNYLKTGGNGDTTVDLVAEFLAKQQADGSFKMENYYDNEVDFINYVLALEIYFGGNHTWGNEGAQGHYGRVGALDYLFSQVKEDDASDGKYFYSLSPNPQGNLRAADVQRYQAEFAILLSRLLSDTDYGKKAKDTLYGVMDYLDYLYTNGEITSTETQGRYLSALIAAANATNNHLKQIAYYNQADAVYTSLQTALALDGSYTAQINTTLAESGDPDATAAVMMGLSDYVNDNCSLATMGHTSSDEERLGADLAGISLPGETLTDLDLPLQGTYGTTFTWQSSIPQCITVTGTVTRQTTETTVILTVTGTNGEATASRTFTVAVAATRSADGDAVATAIANLKRTIPSETVSSLSLPTKTHKKEEDADKNVNISWETSDAALLAADGTVTRPTQGSADGNVVLTATLTKGSVTQTVDFPVLVYAETGDSLTESYYETRVYYLTHRNLSSSYWQAFAAYAALGGDFIQDPTNGYTFYDVSKHKLGQTWQGTDYGAVLLQIMAMGENPYDYNGVNYVAIAEKAGTGGPYASPIFATMGLEAVGAKNYSPATNYSVGQLKESAMTFGVDIAGWAVIALSRHLGEPGVDAAIETFAAIMKANQSDEGYFVYHSMGSNLISTGCVVSGFTALMAAGVDGYDVTEGPWLVNGVSCIDTMYKEGKKDSSVGNFGVQLQIEIADLYNTKYNGGNVMWIACGVTKDKLEAQIAKANAILADQEQYTKASITTLESALATVNDISSDRLNADIPDYGEEYFTLYDAVRYAKTLSGADQDAKAAAAVTELINALPSADQITLNDKGDVTAARTAYDSLSSDQQKLIDAEVLVKLTAAESAITALKDNKISVKNMKDVASDTWYYGDVDFVLAKGMMVGTSATTFGPTETITRAQFITVLGRYAGISDSSAAYPGTSKFSDVVNTAYYAAHVDWAVEKGITKGTSATTFSPNDKISRQDMSVMMARYAAAMKITLPDGSGESHFDDHDKISAYAKEAVYQMKAAGILKGDNHNRFLPQGNALRSEAAAVLHRFITYAETHGDDPKDPGEGDDEDDPDTNDVTFSVEKFTLGQGYIVEPMLVEMEEGDTVADVIDAVFSEQSIEYTFSDTDMGFYMSSIRDNDRSEAHIPQYIVDAVKAEDKTMTDSRKKTNWLGEFDYAEQSGWIYWVNNEQPNYSAGYYELEYGDVIRWQFTVCGLGRDLGTTVGGAAPYVNAADKDALTTAVATINTNKDTAKKGSNAYANAITVLQNMESTQAEVDNALAALK